MIILGIETTCDETSVAIVEDGDHILSLVTFSQEQLHSIYGGVVPELASRRHLDVIDPTVTEALNKASLSISQVDAIAVAHGPGLVGSLLVGINYAQGLALGSNKPLIGINHIEAHLYAAMMGRPKIFPAIGVVLSGGHTSIIEIQAIGRYQLFGQTIDDAIGEAFDKVAKMLALPYPGGPEIEQLALRGDPHRFAFHAGRVKEHPLSFSFSGLKTQVLYALRDQPGAKLVGTKLAGATLAETTMADLAASFQKAAFDTVIQRLKLIQQQKPIEAIYLGGGVTRNRYLRERLNSLGLPCYFPDPELCLDNGAMIAGLAFHKLSSHSLSSLESGPISLRPQTRIPFFNAL